MERVAVGHGKAGEPNIRRKPPISPSGRGMWNAHSMGRLLDEFRAYFIDRIVRQSLTAGRAPLSCRPTRIDLQKSPGEVLVMKMPALWTAAGLFAAFGLIASSSAQ